MRRRRRKETESLVDLMIEVGQTKASLKLEEMKGNLGLERLFLKYRERSEISSGRRPLMRILGIFSFSSPILPPTRSGRTACARGPKANHKSLIYVYASFRLVPVRTWEGGENLYFWNSRFRSEHFSLHIFGNIQMRLSRHKPLWSLKLVVILSLS